MKCPLCQQDNLQEANFCIKCGESLQLERLCHHCGHTNPRGGIFCDECGDLLVGVTPDDIDLDEEGSAEGEPSGITLPPGSMTDLGMNDAQPDLLTELKEGVEKWTEATGKAKRAMEQIARLTQYPQADSPELKVNHDGQPVKGKERGKTRVFVIDRDLLFYQGLHLYISQTDDIEAVGHSADLTEGTVSTADRLLPDIVLIEANLPSFQGLDSARQLIRHSPGTPVIMFSPYRSDDQVFAALKTGVAGYLGKAITGEEFISAIRRVAKGEHIINELITKAKIAQQVLNHFQAMEKEGADITLSPQETELLRFFVLDYSIERVADVTAMSREAIRDLLDSIAIKLVDDKNNVQPDYNTKGHSL